MFSLWVDGMKPSWSDAPEWAQWLARDGDGAWHWFENEPIANNSGFRFYWQIVGVAEFDYEFAGSEGTPGDWLDTLEPRP